MRQFRIITIVDSSQLGDVLGDLQERNCEIVACNVVKRSSSKKEEKEIISEIRQTLSQKEVVTRTEAALGVGRIRADNSPITAVHDWLRDKAIGSKFRVNDIIHDLELNGYNRWSVKHAAVRFVTHSPRFKKVAVGIYQVHNIDEPIAMEARSKPKAAGRPPSGTMSASEWIRSFIGNFEPGTNVTRAAIITAGKKTGLSYASINTALQTAYVQGELERPQMGVYRRKPTAKPEQPPEANEANEVIRHIEEDAQ